MEITPIKELNMKEQQYKKDDLLVIFGEVFNRGYVNGLIEEAEQAGMKVIYATVGRRDSDQNLRPLNAEELKEKNQVPLINIPLEAGFDFEKSSKGLSPVDQLANIKMSQWNEAQIDWTQVQESLEKGQKRFKDHTTQFLSELEQYISEKTNVLFVHTMAGGFPRAKVIMPISNKVFKGYGKRYQSSKEFWESEIGKLCDISFNEVTGETLNHLIQLSEPLRNRLKNNGRNVSYVAYGYHGTESYVDSGYRWQSYSPYMQGWAKLHLEDIAEKNKKQGISVAVYNCPEILTNSTSIFLGVEVCLYPLIGALLKEATDDSDYIFKVLEEGKLLLKEGVTFDDILQITDDYQNNPLIKNWSSLQNWPQHNGPEQMEYMRETSQKLIDLHKDPNQLMTQPLSEVIFKACGKVMFNRSWFNEQPVAWIGQDIVAKVSS